MTDLDGFECYDCRFYEAVDGGIGGSGRCPWSGEKSVHAWHLPCNHFEERQEART